MPKARPKADGPKPTAELEAHRTALAAAGISCQVEEVYTNAYRIAIPDIVTNQGL